MKKVITTIDEPPFKPRSGSYRDQISLPLSVSDCDLVDCFSVGIVIHKTVEEAQAAAAITTTADDESEKLVRQLPSDLSIKDVKMTKLA